MPFFPAFSHSWSACLVQHIQSASPMTRSSPGAATGLLLPLLTLLLLASSVSSRPAPPAAASQQPSSTTDSSSTGAGRRPLQPPVLAPYPPQPLAAPEPEAPVRQLQQSEEAVNRCRDGPEPEAEQEQCVECDRLQRSKTAACRVGVLC